VTDVLTEPAFAGRLVEMAAQLPAGERRIVAIAGPPGAGKSTFTERLASAVADGAIAILPMDGYHYDDELLDKWGRKARKGAPDTFDVAGLKATLARLAANAGDGVAVPRFDRMIEIARAGALWIPRAVPVIVVEGNYLLLDDAPWSGLHEHFDMTALISVRREELRRRLTARWERFRLLPDELRRKVEDIDLKNGDTVVARSTAPDTVISQG